VPASPWGGGVWVQFGFNKDEKPAKVSKDLSAYKDGYLIFWVKTTSSILIKRESEGDGNSQKSLATYNVKTDGTWQKVVMPVKDFTETKTFDLKKVNVVFGAHYTMAFQSLDYWIDNVYLSKTKE
jgi:hypothetical protein